MLFLWGKTPVNDTWKIFIWPGASPLGMIITWKLTEVCGCDCCLSVLLYSHLIWMGWKQEQALFQCEQLQKTSLNYFISLQQECCLLQHLKKKKKVKGKNADATWVFLSIILYVSQAFQTLVHIVLHISAFYTCKRRNFPLTFSGNNCPFQNLNLTLFQAHCDWNQVFTFKQKFVC